MQPRRSRTERGLDLARAKREAERILRFAGWSRAQAVQDAAKLVGEWRGG